MVHCMTVGITSFPQIARNVPTSSTPSLPLLHPLAKTCRTKRLHTDPSNLTPVPSQLALTFGVQCSGAPKALLVSFGGI